MVQIGFNSAIRNCTLALTLLGSPLALAADSAAKPTAASSKLLPATAESIVAQIKRSAAPATIVNVWASWCVPCRQEFPDLLRAWRQHRADGVELILVTTDLQEDRPDAVKFLAQQDPMLPAYYKDQTDQKFIDGLSHEWTGSIPATLVFDRKGELVSFLEGKSSLEEFESAIKTALSRSKEKK